MGEVQGGAPAPAVAPQSMQPNSENVAETPKAAPAAAPQAEQRYEVKINGQIHTLTLQEALSRATLSEAAMGKMQEAAKIRKEMDSFKEEAAKSKIAALKKLGFSNDDIRAEFENWYKENYIDPEMLSAEERAIKERDAKIKEYEEREKQRQEQSEQEKQQALDGHVRNEIQTQIVQALEASGLPKNRFTASRMAFWMKQNLSHGYDAPMDLIVQQVKDERRAIIAEQVQEASPEQLVDLFGDAVIEKLRKYDNDRLSAKTAAITPKESSSQTTKRSNERTRPADVDRFLREMRHQKR